MSIFSSFGNFLGGLGSSISSGISSAYNYVSNALSGITPASQAANVFGSPQYIAKNVQLGLQPATGPMNAYYNPSKPGAYTTPAGTYGNVYGSTAGLNSSGGYGNFSYGPPAPVSYSSGTKTGSLAPTGGYSNYSSPSYSTNLANASSSSSFSSPSSFTAPTSTSVSAGSLGSQKVNIASSPQQTNYQGQVVGGNVGVGAEPSTGLIPNISSTTGTSVAGSPGTASTQNQPPKKNALEEYLASIKPPASEADAYKRAEQESGYQAALFQRQSTQNQINAVTSQMNTDLLQLRGTAAREGVTEAVYGGQQAEVTREATIKLLPLQAQLAADQGNLEMAQSHLDTLYKIYSKDAQNSVDYYNNAAKAAFEYLSSKEKDQVEENSRQKTFEQSVLKTQIDGQQRMAEDALQNGNTRLYQAMTSIRPPTNINSPTYLQDKQNYINDINEAVGRYGTPSIALLIQQQNLANAKLQGEKLKNEIDAGRPATGEYAPVVNAVSSLVGATKAPAVKKAIVDSLASGDYATAYANVANAVEDSLTGSNKTKFADSRTDIGVMSGMRNAINAYVNAGGNLGYLKGTADSIAKRFGQLATDPNFAALGTQLEREFQAYRLSMTGAAFSPAESAEYAKVNPRTNASLDLNLATIDGALAQLQNRVISTVNQRIPDAQKIYEKIPGNSASVTSNPTGVDYRSKYGY